MLYRCIYFYLGTLCIYGISSSDALAELVGRSNALTKLTNVSPLMEPSAVLSAAGMPAGRRYRYSTHLAQRHTAQNERKRPRANSTTLRPDRPAAPPCSDSVVTDTLVGDGTAKEFPRPQRLTRLRIIARVELVASLAAYCGGG